MEPTQGWAQSGLLGRGFGRLESSLPSRTGLVMVQSSYRIHGDLALRPSEDTKIHNVQVSSTEWPNPFISSTQSSHRLSVLSRLLTTECKANAVQMVILAHCLVNDKNIYILISSVQMQFLPKYFPFAVSGSVGVGQLYAPPRIM